MKVRTNVEIIKPDKKQSDDILYLVDELAKYEKLKLPTKSAKQRLLNDIFSKKPLINVSFLQKLITDTLATLFTFSLTHPFLQSRLYILKIYLYSKNIAA